MIKFQHSAIKIKPELNGYWQNLVSQRYVYYFNMFFDFSLVLFADAQLPTSYSIETYASIVDCSTSLDHNKTVPSSIARFQAIYGTKHKFTFFCLVTRLVLTKMQNILILVNLKVKVNCCRIIIIFESECITCLARV